MENKETIKIIKSYSSIRNDNEYTSNDNLYFDFDMLVQDYYYHFSYSFKDNKLSEINMDNLGQIEDVYEIYKGQGDSLIDKFNLLLDRFQV